MWLLSTLIIVAVAAALAFVVSLGAALFRSWLAARTAAFWALTTSGGVLGLASMLLLAVWLRPPLFGWLFAAGLDGRAGQAAFLLTDLVNAAALALSVLVPSLGLWVFARRRLRLRRSPTQAAPS